MSGVTSTLAAVHGRINDLDSHLQVPVSRWGEVFGEATARFGERFADLPFFNDTDEPEATTESVWTTKGTAAPGSSTPDGRLATMDIMGVDKQLIFPQVVLALPAWSDHPNAGRVLREYNEAVIRWTEQGGGRLRLPRRTRGRPPLGAPGPSRHRRHVPHRRTAGVLR